MCYINYVNLIKINLQQLNHIRKKRKEGMGWEGMLDMVNLNYMADMPA